MIYSFSISPSLTTCFLLFDPPTVWLAIFIKQSISLETSTTIAGIQIKVTPHRNLNSCQGVISEQDLIHSEDLEIAQELASQGVKKA